MILPDRYNIHFDFVVYIFCYRIAPYYITISSNKKEGIFAAKILNVNIRLTTLIILLLRKYLSS